MKSSNEILSFLIRAWSEDPNTRIKRGERFSCNPGAAEVYIPDFHDPTAIPQLEGLPRWRWWRFTSFHEAMHNLLSAHDKQVEVERMSREVSDCLPDTHKESGQFWHVTMDVMDSVYNIIEDHRVEKIGLRTYKGYVDEQIWRKVVAAEWWEKHSENVFAKAISTPAQSFIKDMQRSILVDLQPKTYRIHDIKIGLNLVESTADAQELAKTAFRQLVAEAGLPEYTVITINLSNLDLSTEDVKAAEDGDPHLAPVSEGIEQEYSQVAREGDELKANQKYTEVLAEKTMTSTHATSMTPIFHWKGEDWDSLMAGRSGDIQRMQTMLRRWQVGWEETLGDKGFDVDPDEFLLHRISHNGRRKYFINEELIAPKTELCVLFDLSGSINELRHRYLVATGIIAESLDFVGTKFALMSFNGGYGMHGGQLHVVKNIRQRWGKRRRDMHASLESGGGTPLAAALRVVMELARVEGYKRVVVVTDGEPDNAVSSENVTRALFRQGVEVSFLAFVSNSDKVRWRFLNRIQRIARCKVIDTLDELPAAFFELIKA